MTSRKKLIEVALPLEAISRESAHEKSVPRKGHPATMHLWWARRPLAACRAVLFASLVDDPSGRPDLFPTEDEQDVERQRLFRLMEELIKWENSGNRDVLRAAHAEITRSTDGRLPVVVDPFCGGGSIPVEAQRLGLEVEASDLNPVAVLITRAVVELPSQLAGTGPVTPDAGTLRTGAGSGASGLAEDVRAYGRWIRDEAERRIGSLYQSQDGSHQIIAWHWARTVTCPNPACGAEMPLVRSFWLSSKKGKKAWIEPQVNLDRRLVEFRVKSGEGSPPDGTVSRQGARCMICSTPVPLEYVREQGKAGRMGARLMALIGEGRGRVYLSPSEADEQLAATASPDDVPETELPKQALGFRVQLYGMTHHADIFTSRQLVALTTLSNLIREVRDKVQRDAQSCRDQGSIAAPTDSLAYANAVVTYLAFALDKFADWSSTICSIIPSIQGFGHTFTRQAIPMVWDYAELNPFSSSAGNFMNHVEWVAQGLEGAPGNGVKGVVRQLDARAAIDGREGALVCTDPPYYDNIGYADLSDFFYVWLRRTLGDIYPDVFSTVLTPKTEELVATPYRFEGLKEKADQFFESGLGDAFTQMQRVQDARFPLTLFYAFKQAESSGGDPEAIASALASTGWETMLEGLLRAGFAITGTWPMRTERSARSVGIGTNALASSIVLVCRPRPADAPIGSRREFVAALKDSLPDALRAMQHGSIAPVDLAQAAIGPGMAVFSQYAKVLEADGTPMRVRTALALINQLLDEVMAEQESEYDASTRWCISWFEQYGDSSGPYGEADVLARAKGVGVNGLVQDGVVASGGGKVRLLKPDELPKEWDPILDARLPVWEITHHLARALGDGGEVPAATILKKVGGSLGDLARDLAYRLYNTCERKAWSHEARRYNELVAAWPEIQRLSAGDESPEQQRLG